MAWAAVPSKAVVLLLLICYLVCFPLVVGVLVKICSISCKSITFSSAIFDYSLSDTCSSC